MDRLRNKFLYIIAEINKQHILLNIAMALLTSLPVLYIVYDKVSGYSTFKSTFTVALVSAGLSFVFMLLLLSYLDKHDNN